MREGGARWRRAMAACDGAMAARADLAMAATDCDTCTWAAHTSSSSLLPQCSHARPECGARRGGEGRTRRQTVRQGHNESEDDHVSKTRADQNQTKTKSRPKLEQTTKPDQPQPRPARGGGGTRGRGTLELGETEGRKGRETCCHSLSTSTITSSASNSVVDSDAHDAAFVTSSYSLSIAASKPCCHTCSAGRRTH